MDIFLPMIWIKCIFLAEGLVVIVSWNDNILDHFFCSSWNSSWIDQFSFCWKIWSWMLTFCRMGEMFIHLKGETPEIGQQCKCLFLFSSCTYEKVAYINCRVLYSANDTHPRNCAFGPTNLCPSRFSWCTISATKYWSVNYFCQFCFRPLEISFY